MTYTLDKSVSEKDFLVPSPEDFSSKLDGLVNPEQRKNLLQKYQDLYKIAKRDYRKLQNS